MTEKVIGILFWIFLIGGLLCVFGGIAWLLYNVLIEVHAPVFVTMIIMGAYSLCVAGVLITALPDTADII